MPKRNYLIFGVLLLCAVAYGFGETISPNMNLIIPAVGVTTGPQWAADQVMTFNLIDQHDHSPGKGVQITPAGINLSSDLPFNSHNATLLRSSRFAPQGSNISGATDIGALYEVGVDLWYNDGSGNQVRITQSGSVAGASGTITGLPSGTASAAYSASPGTFVFQQATSTAANVDVGTVIIRYPGSYPAPSGNYIAFSAPSGLSTGYQITFPAATPSANGAFLTESTGGALSYTNVDNSTLGLSGGVISVANGGITATQIASTTITAAKIANNTITATQVANSTLTGTQMASNVNLPGTTVQAGGFDVVVSATNPSTNGLAIVRGSVSSSGTITGGEGFTVSNPTTGQYNLGFANFLDTPVIVVTSVNSVSIIPEIVTQSSTFVEILMRNTSGTATNSSLNFIAIGQVN